jgi:putative spermidine/putrescine transport system substrate-binding protein
VRAARPALLLSWDRRKLPASPNWADFWDVAKYPGKRGLRAGPRGTLEIALLADGVAPGDVYATLRGSAGVDRAFRKLDQLRPYLVWWHADAEAATILRTGQVLMSSAPSGTIAAADAEGAQDFGMQWQGSLFGEIDWAMLTGSHAETAAAQFLAFATDPARQAALVPLGYAPPADARPALVIDDAFWRQSGPALRARFAAWLQR